MNPQEQIEKLNKEKFWLNIFIALLVILLLLCFMAWADCSSRLMASTTIINSMIGGMR